ncbi:25.3 kDa vesicle transport protein SEC22-1 [Nicotiana tabacum]|uniref:25.3 kDa vesicle transport protein SEC22-1 n=2 Tax=Nicotiana TaxID=4085 RepID=A0A1S4BRV3_TOBAC|nr:PREDICTED: 25.3 kDa vesicle transport protein [Nicotiana sylvestris]XP_016491619.1 PREDICTED: 25.3 kDa vesicle transport protein-like isoform X1 [Nicotiana tabacum]
MVKLTIIGRVSDGMPLAQCPRFVQQENDVLLTYKQQAEFILKEISLRALPFSRMTILVDHHCFNYIVENGICFLTLCELSYPRKLAFHYLQDLQQEFEKLDRSLTDRITKSYTFIKLDTIIGNIRKQYVDTRTQTNLSKLNADRQKDLDIGTDELSLITERRRRVGMIERMMVAHRSSSPIWESKRLEIIALKRTPITILLVVAAVLLWTGLILQDDFR